MADIVRRNKEGIIKLPPIPQNANIRYDTLYLHGTDAMTTEDVSEYFNLYHPYFKIEWATNGNACAISFNDLSTAKDALSTFAPNILTRKDQSKELPKEKLMYLQWRRCLVGHTRAPGGLYVRYATEGEGFNVSEPFGKKKDLSESNKRGPPSGPDDDLRYTLIRKRGSKFDEIASSKSAEDDLRSEIYQAKRKRGEDKKDSFKLQKDDLRRGLVQQQALKRVERSSVHSNVLSRLGGRLGPPPI